MITEELMALLEKYNDAHGQSTEVDQVISFLADVDDEVINGSDEEQERFINKWLEIYGNR